MLGSGGPAAGCASVALVRHGRLPTDLSSVVIARHEVRLSIWEPGAKEHQIIHLSVNDADALGDALIRAAAIARKEAEL